MFKVIRMSEKSDWWGVYLVHVKNENDRYLMTTPVDKKTAEALCQDFTRILNQE